ncbi:MAG: enoyl-CoA hydratase [Intrasporangium sp.]|uniref:enoyl-CoA hydratase n=1 Tax=Intrasporangium sp. TaxID=1925024 RepID=UPI0026487BB9|nr:enoyl-CoA hydratase [Intrasporangium sp.]MDN5798058.1 enoyl-CoA hydratase [Intrasporangium sp.]
MSATPVWGPVSERAGGQLHLRSQLGAIEVTFNRPEKHNAFTTAMYAELERICELAATTPALRVVVFRGAGGRAFAAGNDISSFTDVSSGADGVAYESRIRGVLDGIAGMPQLTIAAVEGHCVGGGLAVANACDLRIATPTARFGFPIARTLGNALSAPIVLRCAEVFGDPLTREMLLASRMVDGRRAAAVGAVMEVVAPERLEAEVWGVAAGVLHAAPLTIRTTKEQLRDGRVGYDAEADDARLEHAYGSDDFGEGVAAFLAKRQPAFRGEAPQRHTTSPYAAE